MATRDSIDRFLEAVRSGDTDSARELLSASPEMAREDMTVAAILGDADRVEGLLRDDPSLALEPVGAEGWSPLLYLAHSRFHHAEPDRAAGMARAAKLLVDAGASPNAHYIEPEYPDSPQTALYIAAGVTNNPALVRVLLEEGARPDDGESIYHAAEANNVECLQLLVLHGAEISRRQEPWGNTPVYFLLGHHDGTPGFTTAIEGIRWLLEHGADPNETSYDAEETALHRAVRMGHGPATLELLLRHGADPNRPNKAGQSPHTLAVRSGNAAIAELLLKHGAVDRASDVDRFLGICASGDAEGAARYMEEIPGIVGRLGADDMAALPEAAMRGNVAAVRTMLDAGFDVGARCEGGGTALHQAAWWGYDEIIKLLLPHNPPLEIHCTAYDATPLEWAVHGSIFSPRKGAASYPIVVESLIAAGAAPTPRMAGMAPAEVVEAIERSKK